MGRKPTLLPTQALDIRRLYQAYRLSMSALAARYGVSVTMISSIVRGQHVLVKGAPDLTHTGDA